MTNPKRLLAIDLGASGGKCFVGTFEGETFAMQEIHRFAHEGVPFYIADATGDVVERTYWDDTAIYSNMLTGLQTYAREISDTIDSIGIDTWGADGHMVSANGDLLGKVYCYRDHRLDTMTDEVTARIDAERLYAITGIHLQPFNMSNQLTWFVQNRPELLLPGVRFMPIPSLLYYYLGGTVKVDSTWASVTQLMDAYTQTWSTEILDALGIPADIMPEIVPPGAAVGALHAGLAQAAGIKPARLTAVGAHDTACAYASAPIAHPEEALIISSGTWALVGKLVPEPITTDAARAINASNEGGIGNVRFLKNCMGGWLTQELRRIWRIADGSEISWKELDDLTERAEPFTALIDPNDERFYNPANMETEIAGYCSETGQSVPANRGSYTRTVYESLALKYRQVNEELGTCTPASKVVHIVGGGSKNIMLNQFTANATGLPVQAGPVEATAIGNLMIQALGLGLIPNMQAALPLIRNAFPIKTYSPEAPAAWDAAYQKFLALQG